MNALERRFATLRHRLQFVHIVRGVGSVALVVLGGGLAVGFLDWYLRVPMAVRALALVGILSSAVYVALRFLLAPLARKTDDLSLALRVEDEHPHLNDALGSTVEFLKQPDGSDTSPVLRREAVQRALRLAQGCDFEKIIDRRGLRLVGLGAIGAAAVVAGAFWMAPDLAQTAMLRLTDPFGNHSWTRLTLGQIPSRIAIKQPYTIRGQVFGILPSQIRIELEGASQSEKTVALKPDREAKVANFIAPLDMTHQRTSFKFRVWANDGVYPSARGWHEVEVLPPPELASLDGLPSPQIELRFPAYTDLPSPEKLSPGKKDLEFVAGTLVTLRAATNRPISMAWIEYKPENANVTTAAYVGLMGHTGPMNALAIAAGSRSACDRVPALVSEDGMQLNVRFQPWLRGAYVLHLVDNLGLPNPIEADLRVFADPVPVVNLEKPGGGQSLLPDAEVFLKAFAEDDLAVRTLFLEYRRRDAEGIWHDEQPLSLPLFDHDDHTPPVPALVHRLAFAASQVVGPKFAGQPLAALLAGVGPADFRAQEADNRPKMKRVDSIRRWPLAGLVKEGDVVVIRAAARDFNNIVPFNPPGVSHEVELRIIGKSELDRLLDEGMAEVQQKLVRAQQLQDEALKLVKDVQKNKAKAGPLQHEQIIEAEQKQKQIQEQVGAKEEEGIRGELAKLKQMLRDNKLPPSPMQDRLRKLSAELDRLTQEELQEIEQNLLEARKELGQNTKPEPSKDKKSSLDKAQAEQEEAKQALDDLVKFLDPWANMQQVKGKARDILQKQRELKRDTEKLSKEGARDDGKLADAQQNQSERMQDLLNMMDQVEKKRQADGDKKNAKLIRDAAKAVRETPDTMKDARDLLKENRPQTAAKKQTESIRDLEKAIAALEERRDEELDVLRKKNKEFQNKLDDLANDQEQLQKKVQNALKNQNEAERKQELEKLAKDQEKLKEEAEKLRELARLEADRANRDLAKAAQEMDRAAKQLAAGQNPQEAQDQALERIEDAMAKLQEEDEELAREQLTKIADQIKGLKERQDSQVERSGELHKRVLQSKRWSRTVFPTLDANADVQRGLASETESLKEKLKDAKVFEMILDKAGKAMVRAADSMKDRKEMAVERQEEFEPEIEKDENRRQTETLKHQQEASRRLGRILDALKEELAKMEKKDKNGAQPGGEGGEGGQQGGIRAQDGIPAMAQLKALREEQQEVNDRTKEFADRRPDPNVALSEPERIELRELHAEQARVQEMFDQLTTQQKKEMP